MKTCITCKKEKDTTCYWNQSGRDDGLYPECKSCAREKHRKRRRTRMGLAQDIYKRQKVNAKIRGYGLPSYSKEWFVHWLLSHPRFDKIYEAWVDSGYKKELGPSVDRIDDSKGYTITNIRLTTWDQNNKQQYTRKKNGVNTKNCKKVYQFTMDGELIREYHSIAHAIRKTGIGHISQCATNKHKQAGGYKRSFTPYIKDV